MARKTSPSLKKKTARRASTSSPSKKKSGGSTRAVKSREVPLTVGDLCQQVREEIWPVERKTLFNPERLRYVRKLIKPEGCVFCHAVEKGVGFESLLLHATEHAIVVLNKYPYNNGHLLILPRRHCGDFLEITDDEHRAMNHCLQKAIHALTEAYRPSGFNVGLNLGSAAGAGIPEHLHYHVIPRWSGDTNFFALIAETKVVVETLEQTFDRLLPYFEGSKS